MASVCGVITSSLSSLCLPYYLPSLPIANFFFRNFFPSALSPLSLFCLFFLPRVTPVYLDDLRPRWLTCALPSSCSSSSKDIRLSGCDLVRAGSYRSPALIVNFLYLGFYDTKDVDLGTAGGICYGTDFSLQWCNPSLLGRWPSVGEAQVGAGPPWGDWGGSLGGPWESQACPVWGEGETVTRSFRQRREQQDPLTSYHFWVPALPHFSLSQKYFVWLCKK